MKEDILEDYEIKYVFNNFSYDVTCSINDREYPKSKCYYNNRNKGMLKYLYYDPLWCAIKYVNLEIFKMLLEKGFVLKQHYIYIIFSNNKNSDYINYLIANNPNNIDYTSNNMMNKSLQS